MCNWHTLESSRKWSFYELKNKRNKEMKKIVLHLKMLSLHFQKSVSYRLSRKTYFLRTKWFIKKHNNLSNFTTCTYARNDKNVRKIEPYPVRHWNQAGTTISLPHLKYHHHLHHHPKPYHHLDPGELTVNESCMERSLFWLLLLLIDNVFYVILQRKRNTKILISTAPDG